MSGLALCRMCGKKQASLLFSDHLSRGMGPPTWGAVFVGLLIQLLPLCFVVYLIYAGGGKAFWVLNGKEVEPLKQTHAALLMATTVFNEVIIVVDHAFIWQTGILSGVDTMLLVFVCFHGVLFASVILPAFLANELAHWMIVVFAVLYVVGTIWEQVADYQLSQFVKAKQAGETDRKIMDTGLWSVCRHPNYLGYQCKWTAFALLSGSVWVAVLWYFVYLLWFYVQAMPAHEGHMAQNYGHEWEDYCGRVPYYYPCIIRPDHENAPDDLGYLYLKF